LTYPDTFIFIVGNSRSGTTMMLRIFNNHPQLMVLNELHFFEQLWTPSDQDKIITKEQAVVLAEKLLLRQRKGYNTGFSDYTIFSDEANTLVQEMGTTDYTAEGVFTFFAEREVALNGKSIVCEKTPQNVFYLKEIFDHYPNARIINMVRDPRAVMLSQKNKWKRRKLGGWYITRREAIRLRINYHPITLSKLWNAAIGAALKFKDDKRMLTVIFEELLEQPEAVIHKICDHIGVAFNPEMLQITQESSSIEMDSEEKGFKKERAVNWRKGGLNETEIWWCQQISGKYMQQFGFEMEDIRPNYILVFLYLILFPVKLGLAFLMNLDRMKNIIDTLKRRLA
jgi:omega-hydroxy-beta-dihydromenaquinone-9 sulfotransferase